MASVILTSVTKVYPGGVTAVDRADLRIEDQEFVVLVGPSGCGKSTTLRLIAGLEEISSGQIEIGGRVVNDVAPKDRDIAMVFQNYALYPHMTVYKNMAFSLMLRRRELGLNKADIDKKVRETAATLGITELLQRRPKALSGGQRQRVAVGRAIVRNPKVFLFDEPLSNLDARLRVEMRTEIKRLQRGLKTTTVYVTHDQEEAMTLGDRVVVMKDGLVHQCASPLEVYERPANRFVASFMGTPQMSFIEGRLVAQNGGAAFVIGSAAVMLPDEFASRLRLWLDRAMVLGLRPDAFSVMQDAGGEVAANGATVIDVRIEMIELLGDRKDVYMRTAAGQSLLGRFDARAPIREGETVRMRVDVSRVHVFEPGTSGTNVLYAASGKGSANAN